VHLWDAVQNFCKVSRTPANNTECRSLKTCFKRQKSKYQKLQAHSKHAKHWIMEGYSLELFAKLKRQKSKYQKLQAHSKHAKQNSTVVAASQPRDSSCFWPVPLRDALPYTFTQYNYLLPQQQPSVLWCCWLGGRKGIRPVKNLVTGCSRGYLSGARCRLASAQLMPLPLIVSCFSKIQIDFTFLVPDYLGSIGKKNR